MSKKVGLSLKRTVGREKDLFVFGGNAFWIIPNSRLVSDSLVYAQSGLTDQNEELDAYESYLKTLNFLANLMESRREPDHDLVLDTIKIPEGEVLNEVSTPVTVEWLLRLHLEVEDVQELQSMFLSMGGEGKAGEG